MNKQARGLVSKETVVLRRWGCETRNVDLSSELTRSDEGLTLETSAFKSLYGGQFTLSTQLKNPKFLAYEQPDRYRYERVH